MKREASNAAANVSRRHLGCRENAPADVGGYTLSAKRARGETSGLRAACATGLLPLLLLLALADVVQAQWNYTINNGTITITEYTGPGGAVTIPSTINGLPVTSILVNDLHLEVSDALRVGEAHALASTFEEALRRELPGLDRIVTHLEPVGARSANVSAVSVDAEQVRRIVTETAHEMDLDCDPHDVQITTSDDGLAVSCHCALDAGIPLTEAHRHTEQFEGALRARLPALGRVVIHTEPHETGPA